LGKVPVWQGFSGRNRLNSHSAPRPPHLRAGSTTGRIQNGATTGYAAAVGQCQASFGPGAHICSNAEVLTSVENGVLPNGSGEFWIATGALAHDPAFTPEHPVNDCYAFTLSSVTGSPSGFLPEGFVWDTTPISTGAQKGPTIAACSNAFAIGCCK
jgi:hypothetical protein